MTQEVAAQTTDSFDLGPPLGWVIVDLAASGANGVLRTLRPRGPAQIHFLNGQVTRVQAEDLEPLVAFLVRKQLLSALEMRSAICEVEHLDITLGDAFEKLGLMDKLSLDRLRARRTREALEEVVAEGGRGMEFESRVADNGPPIDAIDPVIRGTVSSGAAAEWLEINREVGGTVHPTENLVTLKKDVLKSVARDLVGIDDVALEEALDNTEEQDELKLAAMIVTGLFELRKEVEETAESLEKKAASIELTEEACRLLIQASELYEARGDSAEARRAALSALRRRPTAAAPLLQVEKLCIQAEEVATLELVYELVNGAMPGPHGRRALLYRAGRVFENEFGDVTRAREYYQRSLGQVAESGAVLDGLRRTCLALDDRVSVADAFTAVGLAVARPSLRLTWFEKALDIAVKAGDERRIESIKAYIAELGVESSEAGTDAGDALEAMRADPFADGNSDDAARAAAELGDEGSEGFDWSSLDDAFPTEDEPKEAPADADDRVNPSSHSSIAEALGDESVTGNAEDSVAPVDPSSQDSAFWGRALLEPVEEDEPSVENEVLLTPGSGKHPSKIPESRYPTRPSQHPGATSDSGSTVASEIDELCGALAAFPNNIDNLRALREATESAIDEPAAQAATSLLALFDRDFPSCPLGRTDSLRPLSLEVIEELATPPDHPEVQALAALWRAASQLVTKELADLGVGRAIPQRADQPSPATSAFTMAVKLLPVEPVRLLHMAAGPLTKTVLSRPISVLAGPGASIDSADVAFRITRAVACCHPQIVLPALMSGADLTITLQAIHAAFGKSPPRGSLHYLAASLAQDLWTAVPRDAQEALRGLLSNAALPDVDQLRTEALAASHRMALLVTGDAAAAFRTAVSDDPFLAGNDPTTEEGYLRAVERSEHIVDLVRMALWPRYWEIRLGG